MKVIYKYPIAAMAEQELWLPRGSKAICVGPDVNPGPGQEGLQKFSEPIALWATVTADNPRTRRMVYLVGTGKPTPVNFDHLLYVGTVFLRQEAGVYHIYISR